jgi:hypothetical protein
MIQENLHEFSSSNFVMREKETVNCELHVE